MTELTILEALQDCWGLTRKQARVFRFIAQCYHRDGYSPTMEEIATKLGFVPSMAFVYVQHLESKGAVRFDRGRARGIVPRVRWIGADQLGGA